MPRWTSIRFAASAARHGISRDRALHVIEHCPVATDVPAAVDPRWAADRLVFLWWDQHGVPLEVIAIEEDAGELFVVHAMKLRRKYEARFTRAMTQ